MKKKQKSQIKGWTMKNFFKNLQMFATIQILLG